eukprot:CAMPEP_0114414520 /NCGR_PEP_ID=MMETSP0103-20121206/1431_1 /TAXON_ID=37642 ORGANISM="Paraphysomonas imperforata, Strain PA2" /NCGR_SAMPLE_ID=MMETSP0103 /ASSEMBLY_ACC=CAM_ASM_000201 /LENGTH=938 /DNA_ID=CAMNT_0001582665 /DNA_START=205 /DNA_END=3021 /DNA_ORIENTATION=+
MKHTSFVGDFEIPAAPAIDMCEIQNNGEESYFCTRTFVIRYRDENHEINEGTHWRLTIPEFDLSLLDQDTQAISCPELLTLRFNLYQCDLHNVVPSSDLMKDLESHLPPEPQFKLFASEDIHMQQACSGFHQYFPVHFTAHQDASIEVLLHSAITRIAVTDSSSEELGRRRSRDVSTGSQVEGGGWFTAGGGDLTPALLEDHYTHSTPAALSSDSSTLDDAPSSLPEVVSPDEVKSNYTAELRLPPPPPDSHVPAKQSHESPSRLRQKVVSQSSSTVVTPPARGGCTLHMGRLVPSVSSTTPKTVTHDDDDVAKCGLLKQEVEAYWDQVAATLSNNGREIAAGAQAIVQSVQQDSSQVDDAELAALSFENITTLPREEVVEVLMEQESVPEVKMRIAEFLHQYSDNVLKVWSQVVGYCTRNMPKVCEHLQQEAAMYMRAFWKGQCIVHTCSAVAMKLPRHTEESVSNLLLKTLRSEDSRLPTDSLFVSAPSTGSSSASSRRRSASYVEEKVTPPKPNIDEGKALLPYARGLRVYDAAVHKNPSKLPVLVVQQYQNNSNDTDTLELLRRGDTFIRNSSAPADVHMSLLHQAGVYLPGLKVNTSRNARLFAAGNPSPSRNMHRHSLEPDSTLNKADEVSVDELELENKLAGTGPSVDTASKPPSYKGKYLVVLVHGFQGTAYDMKMLKNAMRAEFSEGTLFLSSKYNERNSGASLADLAKRLASEIIDFIDDKCPEMLNVKFSGRIVFVGHSAGGLVIRKCLEDARLKCLTRKLHTYMSLSTPHLGTQYGESQLVSTGMWALYKLKKSPLLHELALKDSNSELYRLSENGVLQYFDRVVFVSSPKDLYVPFYSARVLVNSRAALDAKTGHVVVEMAANLMTQIEPDRLFRVTLDNQVDQLKALDTMKNVDKVIGRAAHICYLEDKVVAMQLVKTLFGLLS